MISKVKKSVLRWWPIGVLLAVVLLFFWKVWIKGLVPFPGDLMVGAYYPWLEYKWGYDVGVPIKNPLISDVFSQVYIWKYLAIEAFKNGEWPLWNPYVYSGYPLLASFSGGVLYTLNLLLLGGIDGWSVMIALQVLGSLGAIYWFLRLKKIGKVASLGGALVYAMSAAMMVRLEWNTAGQVMWWLATGMLVIEYYFERSRKAVVVMPAVVFMLVSAGHFQTMLYGLFLIVFYWLYRWFEKRLRRDLVLLLAIVLGVVISSVQLLPTFVMMRESVRLTENAVAADNFGLLPWGNLITMLAPDFFGNPTTLNYWGIINYSETVFYAGIVGLASFFWALLYSKKLNRSNRFFLMLAILAVILAFDGPIGRAVYEYKVPFLSTGYAARVLVVFAFSSAILSAEWIDKLRKMKLKEVYLPLIIFGLMFLVTVFVTEYAKRVFNTEPELVPQWLVNIHVARRNLIWPTLMVIGLSVVLLLRIKFDIRWLVVVLIVLDVFRFGWKYNPFVPKDFVYPETEVISFLKNSDGVYRIETKAGPFFPANTWVMYGLYSASGYDPLAPRTYARGYSDQLNGTLSESRYSILGNYNSRALGEFNVKYLLIDKEYFTKGVQNWRTTFETEKMLVLENPDFKERVEWREGEGKVMVESYSANEIKIKYESGEDGEIIVRDNWDDGWKAVVNGEEREIDEYNNVFRSVRVPAGSGEVVMKYQPKDWVLGKQLALIGSLSWLVLGINQLKKK